MKLLICVLFALTFAFGCSDEDAVETDAAVATDVVVESDVVIETDVVEPIPDAEIVTDVVPEPDFEYLEVGVDLELEPEE